VNADFESVDSERRALLMEVETYRDCIADAGGLEALRALCVEQVPVSPKASPRLAAWKAFVEAGGLDGGPVRLPWLEVESSLRHAGWLPAVGQREAPSGASRRSAAVAA
jgi:hypothetical protein